MCSDPRPSSLSSMSQEPPILFDAQMLSFLDMLGGFLYYPSNSFHRPMRSGIETPPFGFSIVMPHGLVVDPGSATPIGDEGATAAAKDQGEQWSTTQQNGAD